MAESSSEPTAKRRFESVSVQEVDTVITERVPKSTSSTTKGWVKVFMDYAADNGTNIDLATCSKDELNEALCKTYLGIRTQKKEYYQRSSYQGFRAAINRHLAETDRDMNIFTDPEFRRSNQAYDGILKKLKRQGELNATQSKAIISTEDFAKINKLFLYSKEPSNLNMEVWFYLTYHHGLRGREVQCRLTKESLTLCKDNEGKDYYTLNTNFSTKNHQGGASENTATKQAGRIQCPQQVL
eukprot:scpid97844/ scgid9429/ 